MSPKKNKTGRASAESQHALNQNTQEPFETSPPPPNEATNSQPTSRDAIYFFKDDETPYGFLYQWYRCRFTDPDSSLVLNCAEQWMMWHKAQSAHDDATAVRTMTTTSPRTQKQLGREIVGFDPAEWDEIKMEVVEQGNYLKSSQGTNVASLKMDDTGDPVLLRELLLATGDRELAEASRFDRVWGIGFDAQQAVTTPREKWGQSLLGEALMNVRNKIRGGTEVEWTCVVTARG